jgi:hypothetical protein
MLRTGVTTTLKDLAMVFSVAVSITAAAVGVVKTQPKVPAMVVKEARRHPRAYLLCVSGDNPTAWYSSRRSGGVAGVWDRGVTGQPRVEVVSEWSVVRLVE